MSTALGEEYTSNLTCDANQWYLEAIYAVPVTVPPPTVLFHALVPVVADQDPGGYELQETGGEEQNWARHRRLLEYSLREYSDIWEMLARA